MGKALDTVANVGLAVGIAGLVGGTAMILVGAPANPRRASTDPGEMLVRALARR